MSFLRHLKTKHGIGAGGALNEDETKEIDEEEQNEVRLNEER